MKALEKLLAQYDYPLTKEMIALTPASPRDSAKLLVYNRATGTTIYDSTFAHLADFIPAGALLVFNDTKVIPARLYARKSMGGIVEILCTEIDVKRNRCCALANKRLAMDDALTIGKTRITVLDTEGSDYLLGFDQPVMNVIARRGTTPIPPYLKHTPLSESALRTRYQSLFAKRDGSIAAPTASLHFTKRLLAKPSRKHIDAAHVTLHVNLGTFTPLTEKALRENKLHSERFSISKAAAQKINAAKKAGRPVIAVGTTAARTLESAAQTGALVAQSGKTRLFIREGYPFQIVDGLITNFHVPRSSLLMLVAAMTGREKLFELYRNAAEHGFHFLSFGDGMLVL